MKCPYRILLYAVLCISILATSCRKDSNSSGASQQTGAGGSLARFAIVGNYLYIVDLHDLDIFNITDPAKPSYVSSSMVGFDIETIFSHDGKLFMGASNGMYIYSIANPEKPVKEASVTHFRACDPVVSSDSLAYVTLRSGGGTCGSNRSVLFVYDVKNIKGPKLVKEVEMKSPYGLGIKQKGLYVTEGVNGMVVFDLTNPQNPVKKLEFKDEIYFDVIPYGDVLIAYIEQGVSFFDITDALNPKLLSKVKG